ncbi:hypothetical protein BJ878DRAFT_542591 [Calycina marina]|uniref:Uncharacterized protein n=1 Tax=Calycina marina TaxID=1763456 RepID=A0A9P7Z2K5_9HELO|nr:hypothetical protein BJ878DRAFT_542591 [Calycina marina]
MEISSEHDFNLDVDDIDIDIDLTGDLDDEDHMLEDIVSNADVGNENDHHLTPLISHDDLMADDDDDKSAQMEDAVTPRAADTHMAPEAGNHHMEDTVNDMSFEDHIDFDESKDVHTDNHIEAEEISWEDNDEEPETGDNVGEVPLAFGGLEELEDEAPQHEPETGDNVGEDLLAFEGPKGLENEAPQQNLEIDDNVDEDLLASEGLDDREKEAPQQEPEYDEDLEVQEENSLHDDCPLISAYAIDDTTGTGKISLPGSQPQSPQDKDAAREAPAASELTSQDANSASVSEPEYTVHTFEPVEGVESTVLSGESEFAEHFHGVKVIYLEVEYNMFSTSDTDNPDTYFLSDTSVARHSASELFLAMRGVIHDDIYDGELLIISIDGLGIVFDEVSSQFQESIETKLKFLSQESPSAQNITIWSIMELHQSLQINDGADVLQPLFIRLDKKPAPAHRLEYLIARAAEGVGLAEAADWDAGSKQFEDFARNEEAFEEHEDHESLPTSHNGDDEDEITAQVNVTGDTEGDVVEESSDIYHFGDLEADPSNQAAAHEFADQIEPSGNTNAFADQLQIARPASPNHTSDKAFGVTVTVHSSEKLSSDNSLTLHTGGASHNVQQSKLSTQCVHVHDEKKNEEDDLIDYSDDEIEIPNPRQLNPTANSIHNGTSTSFIISCYIPELCFCDECNMLILAGSEKNQEQTPSRSYSTANGKKDEEMGHGEIGGSAAGQQPPDVSEERDEIEYDEIDFLEEGENSTEITTGNGLQVQDDVNAGEDFDAELEIDLAENDATDTNNAATSAASGNASLDFPDDFGVDDQNMTINDQSDNGLGLGQGEEIDYDDFDFGESITANGVSAFDASLNSKQPGQNPLSATVGDGDHVDAESSGSDDTLVAHPKVDLEPSKDEIDYDDDDDDDDDLAASLPVAPQTTLTTPAFTGGNKRARSVASLDDDSGSNEPKRPKP